jgi:hypothetical protein
MTEKLPAPLLPATVDLRVFDRMPLNVKRLRDSEISRAEDAEGFRCAVLAWCAAWHQVPAASLPDDDRSLADLVGVGRTARAVKEWRALRPTALRGFVKCTDTRLYHPVIAEIAIESWGALILQRFTTECGRLRKECQRQKKQYLKPDPRLWITGAYPDAIPYLSQWKGFNVPWDKEPESQGQPPSVPRETHSNGSEGILPTSSSSGNSDTVARSSSGQPPGPEARKATPPTVAGDTPWQARIRAQGWEKGIEPRSQESWDDFAARVRTTKAAA